VGSIKFPGGMLRIANRNPAAPDEIDVIGEALDFGRFEGKWVLRDQDQGIGATLELYGAANVGEDAVTGADVVMRFIGIEVLVVVVKLDVAASEKLGGLLVVFHVIGAKTFVAIVDVHITIRDEKIAALLLRAGRPDFYLTAFRRAQMNLLRHGGNAHGKNSNEAKRGQAEKETRRGKIRGVRASMGAKHFEVENRRIA